LSQHFAQTIGGGGIAAEHGQVMASFQRPALAIRPGWGDQQASLMHPSVISSLAKTRTVTRPRMRLVPAVTAMLLASGMMSGPTATTAAPLQNMVPCPAAATAQLDGFYRWFLTTKDGGRSQLQSQKQRFSPELYRELRAAFALQPADGRFVDFDPFSNSQVGSYGHRIAGCQWNGDGLLLMRVEVFAGLGSSRTSPLPLDYVLSPSGQSWPITDIRYPGEVNFSLRSNLQGLLKQP
jgi:hypothetical protein